MARILDFFLNRGAGKACQAYPDHEQLLQALQREEPGAIHCLSSKTAPKIYQIGKGFNLTDEDIEELQCDCIMLFIKKLRTGQYVFQGYSPASYVIEVAKKRVRFKSRQAQRGSTFALDNNYDPADESGTFPGSQENVEWLGKLLKKVGENCQKLIQLYYVEELKDKDVVEQGLTQYNSVDALKNHRSKCMKKVAELREELKAEWASLQGY